MGLAYSLDKLTIKISIVQVSLSDLIYLFFDYLILSCVIFNLLKLFIANIVGFILVLLNIRIKGVVRRTVIIIVVVISLILLHLVLKTVVIIVVITIIVIHVNILLIILWTHLRLLIKHIDILKSVLIFFVKFTIFTNLDFRTLQVS